MKIHISREGEEVGTFELEQLQDAVGSGRVLVTDLAWMEGMEEWAPLATIAEVSFDDSPTPPPIPSNPPPLPTAAVQPSPRTRASGSSVIAGVVGLVVAAAFFAQFIGGDNAGTASASTDEEPLTVTAYGHSQRGEVAPGLLEVAWHVRLRNTSHNRLSNLYVAYNWLDQNDEKLSYTNTFTSIGPGEELTVSGSHRMESRLFAQVANIGLDLSSPPLRQNRVLPLVEAQGFESSPVVQRERANTALIRAIYGSNVEQGQEAAAKFMVGTWVYTGNGWAMWIKWVVRPDGTVDQYRQLPTANDWGKPEAVEWEIRTDKFLDTGKRYFAFHIKGQATQAIIREDGSVIYRLPDGDLEMQRGDQFPFSK